MGTYERKLVRSILEREAEIKRIIAEAAPNARTKSAAATEYLNCMMAIRKLNREC